jgi:3-hydroxy-9,10-secoandrosta-1,3,5(10)-triene-9,17-dione monooxygenase
VMEIRDQATKLDRARWVATLASIVHDCRATLASISEASGATAHFLSHGLQRDVRDLNTMCGHLVFDLDSALENYGRISLGKEPSSLVF